MIWNLNNLIDHCRECKTEIYEGKWIPCRPINNRSILTRVKEAWMVFCGKGDVFIWPEKQ